MSECITACQLHESESGEVWRVVVDGTCAFVPVGSLAAGAQPILAIRELPGIDNGHTDVDLRRDGVSVCLFAATDDCYGMARATWISLARSRRRRVRKDLALTRQGSRAT